MDVRSVLLSLPLPPPLLCCVSSRAWVWRRAPTWKESRLWTGTRAAEHHLQRTLSLFSTIVHREGGLYSSSILLRLLPQAIFQRNGETVYRSVTFAG